MRVGRALLITTVFVTGILAVQPFLAFGQQTANAKGADWAGPNGNFPFNMNFNPQSTITSDNAKSLQVKWIWPVPLGPNTYNSGSPFGYNGQGVIVTPLIVKGLVYFVTNYHQVFALDARSGKTIWTKILPVLKFNGNINPFWGPFANVTGHYHAIWHTDTVRGQPLVWLVANNYTIFAFNALTGDTNLAFKMFDLKGSVPGNFGQYGTITPQIVIDEQKGILVAGVAVSEAANAGRGFFLAYDITQTPPRQLWRTFIIPPQDGSDPSWSIKSVQNMTYASIFDGTGAVDLKALSPTQLHDVLYADWGNFGFNGTHSFAGAATGWGGSWALDPHSHIAYVATAQTSPDTNASARPGPNLWANSVLALDVTSGQMIWAFKAVAHDLWDYDCSWNVILANATISGQQRQVVFKACKSGYVFALDAKTGKLLWNFLPPSLAVNQYSKMLNPLSKQDMTKPWFNYPSTKQALMAPGPVGGIESDIAYDPTLNTVFCGPYNYNFMTTIGPIKGPGVSYISTGSSNAFPSGPVNATVWAVDANTGKSLWSYYVPAVGFRGGITVSGGVVYVPLVDGTLRMLDAKTGKAIDNRLIGGPMAIQPSIGADADGNFVIIEPASTAGGALVAGAAAAGAGSPGYIFALGLPAGQEQQTQTVVNTLVSTSVQTVAGPSTGISPEAFYGAVGVAVIFVVATSALAVRLRKPAT